MKKLVNSLLVAGLVFSFASCSNDLDTLEDGNHRNHEVKDRGVKKTVRMSFGGDIITESDEPLLRADDLRTFTGINVYRTEKDKDDAKEEKYAYGVFDRKDGISIDVVTGFTYRFEATILIENDDRLTADTRNLQQPFRLQDKGMVGFDSYKGYDIANLGYFTYTYTTESEDSKEFLSELSFGTAYVKGDGNILDAVGGIVTEVKMQYPRVKRFYGANQEYDPSSSDEVEIPMDYKSFGLKIVVESIPNGTSVSVSDVTSNANKNPKDDPEYYLLFPKSLSLNNDSREWECIYSLNNLKQDNKEFTLCFSWDKGAGVKDNFYHKVKVEAKQKKVLKLNIEGVVNESKKGNIVFTNVDDRLTDSEEDVTNVNQ